MLCCILLKAISFLLVEVFLCDSILLSVVHWSYKILLFCMVFNVSKFFASRNRCARKFNDNLNLNCRMPKHTSKPLNAAKSGCISKLLFPIFHSNSFAIPTHFTNASSMFLLRTLSITFALKYLTCSTLFFPLTFCLFSFKSLLLRILTCTHRIINLHVIEPIGL